MNKITLVGGSGYIGTVLTKNFLDKGFRVTNLDINIYNNFFAIEEFLDHPNYSFKKMDILGKNNLENFTDSDIVVVLAGLVGDPITKTYPKESSLINDIGIKRIIDTCFLLNIKKFIFISTCSNYGLKEDKYLAREESSLSPLSLYAKSKVDAEKYILSLKKTDNFNPTILRFATAFGLSPRMRFDLTISEFTRDIAFKKQLLVYDANTWRPYCHVEDFFTLIKKVIDAPKQKVAWEIFNAGGEINNATKQHIVDMIIEFIPDANVKYRKVGSDPRNYRVDFTKVKSILGFEPKYTIRDGIIELLEAIKSNKYQDVDDKKISYGNYKINY